MVGGWVWDSVNVRGGPSIFVLPAPRSLSGGRRSPRWAPGASAPGGEEAASWYLEDRKELLALILWRLQLVAYLNYL
jgi:hypothetical protein